MAHSVLHSIAHMLEARDRLDVCNRDPDGYIINDDKCYVPFWYTRTGVIVKWVLFVAFVTLIGGYILIGHIHAKKRMRKGLPPLAYHRWLVSRAQLARVDPRYAYPQPAGVYTYQPDGYGMNYMPPPPVYDPNAARPPMYNAPTGATKTDPNQWAAEPSSRPAGQQAEQYEPPAGPPPPGQRPY